MREKKRKQNSDERKRVKAYSFREVFGQDFKSEAFKDVYLREIVRLRLARQMREMRLARKLTQKDIAEKAKMPQSVVARMESGKHSPSLYTLERIAQVFGKEVQLA